MIPDATMADRDPSRKVTTYNRDGSTADSYNRARTGRLEAAVLQPRENAAAILAHNLGVPVEITTRIIALETELFIQDSLIKTLYARIAAIESKV